MAGRVRSPGHTSWSPFGSAPQSSSCSTGVDDVERRMVHYVKAASTGCAKLTGAGPDHLLIGTVALFRMEKRVTVAEHHFRHPCAPRWPVRRLARRDPPTAAVAEDARQSVSPSHWSRPGPRSGRPSPDLQRRSACGDRTAPVLSPSTTLVRATNTTTCNIITLLMDHKVGK